MKTAQDWFDEYGVSHQTRFNKIIHYFCVPSILFSVVGLLASIPLGTLPDLFPSFVSPYIHLGTVLIVVALAFYASISISIFIGMLPVGILSLWGNRLIDESPYMQLWLVSLVIFAIAWIFQFIGHKHEGKKPSFFKDLQFLLVGPAWILGHLYKKINIAY